MGRLEALLRRCQAGDAEALEELVRRWERQLLYYLRRLADDEADAWDMLQQTWVRVLQGIGGVRDADQLVPWMYRVARNAALTHRRSRLARERNVDPAGDVETLPAPAEALERNLSAEEVHHGMRALSVHHREVLTLFFLEDFSIEEMSAVLDVSAGTVKSRLFYAKRALGAALEKTRSRS